MRSKMKEEQPISPLLRYPYVNELSSGCKSIVKKMGLWVQCDKTIHADECCCICSLNLNNINKDMRVVGGFHDAVPNGDQIMLCYRKVMKKMGYTITQIKQEAKKRNKTLNYQFIDEMSEKKTHIKKKKERKDVSIVSDSDDDDYAELHRKRGRPKKENTKNDQDLIQNLIQQTNTIDTDEECEPYYDDEEEEVNVTRFEYYGTQSNYIDLSLFKDEQDVIYNNLGEILGTYYEDRNEIIDHFD